MSSTGEDVGSIIGAVAQGALGGVGFGPIGAGAGAALALGTKLAPQIGKWIGLGDTEVIGRVVNTVQAAVGSSPPVDHTQLDTGTATALTAQLAQIAADRDAVDKDHKLAMKQAELDAVQQARQQMLSLAQAGSPLQWGAPIISLVVTIGFFLNVTFLMFHQGQFDLQTVRIIDAMTGIMGSMFTAVVMFWVGSAASSNWKTGLIADMGRNMVDNNVLPKPMIQPAPAVTPQPIVLQPPLAVPTPPAALPAEEPQPSPPVPVQPSPPSRQPFFDAVRHSVFGGHLVQSQVDGCNQILNFWDLFSPTEDVRHLAYVLATVCWETGRTMQPVEEVGRGAGRYYGPSGFYGRGLVQITLEDNYRKMSPVVGADLVAHPEKALEWPIALKLLFVGMAQGMFTGKRLSDYFNASTSDPVGARAIINGHDRAQEIAAYYSAFLAALDTEGSPLPTPEVVIPSAPLPPIPTV